MIQNKKIKIIKKNKSHAGFIRLRVCVFGSFHKIAHLSDKISEQRKCVTDRLRRCHINSCASEKGYRVSRAAALEEVADIVLHCRLALTENPL